MNIYFWLTHIHMCLTRLVLETWHTFICVRHTFTCVWLTHMWIYVWHDSFLRHDTHLYVCDTTPSWDMTHIHMCLTDTHSYLFDTTRSWDMTYIHMCVTDTHMNMCMTLLVLVTWHTCICVSWVGSLKLHVSFAKEPYKRDSILQKRPMISKHDTHWYLSDPTRMCVSHTRMYVCQSQCECVSNTYECVSCFENESCQTYIHIYMCLIR